MFSLGKVTHSLSISAYLDKVSDADLVWATVIAYSEQNAFAR
jgi:hypothetical protein